MLPRLAVTAGVLMLLLTGCNHAGKTAHGRDSSDSLETPRLGVCRMLQPKDIGKPDNSTATVSCSEDHTAETFAVGTFPPGLAKGANIENPDLGAYVYGTCSKKFQEFLGGDESLVMRSLLTWAWFRPSKDAWKQGARWYRCDVVGGTQSSKELRHLPKTAKGLLLGRGSDAWMSCANGDKVAGSEKVPCSEPHTWRAVTTIKVGREDDPYPGDRLVEVRTRDFCSDSVGAWMNYPVNYDFGYTYFHEAEWKAGNRRSICWARTDK